MPARLADGRPALALGVKGALSVRVDVRSLNTDVHSMLAAVAPSAAWRLVEALSSLRDRAGTVRVAGFYDAVLDPTEAERRTIADDSDATERAYGQRLGIEQFVDGVTGAPWRERLAFGPTCNIAGIHSGYGGPGMKTVLPASASAWLDLRLVPDQRPDDVLALLRAHLDAEGFSDVALEVLGRAEPAGTPIEHPFVQRVARVAERVTGQRPLISPRIGGTLPIIASLQRHLGVAGVSAPGNPLYFGAGLHAPNEHVRLEDLGHAARFTHALLHDLGDPPTVTRSP